jgi:triacylglycerol lipase
MLARLQQFIVLAAIASVTGCVVHFADGGRSIWAGLVPVVVLFGFPVLLGLQFALLGLLQHGSAPHRASASQLIGAWRDEVAAAARVFFWRQPFRSNAELDSLPAQPGGQRGVVLVHGLFCNRGFWTPWLQRLRTRGVPFIAVNLEPLSCSIDRYGGIIESAVQRMALATGSPVVLVGHSMGGLAIRAWLHACGGDHRVHRAVTIGTPHKGTWLARWAYTTNGQQMRLGSDWLRRLQASEPGSRQEHFTCFFGDCDNIVFPAHAATLARADNRHLPGTAHVQMAFHAAVFDEVWRWLASPARRDSLAPS